MDGKFIDIPLEFDEGALPAQDTEEIFQKCGAILEQSEELLIMIDKYSGCSEECRKAMMECTEENEKLAFEALIVAVDSMKVMFDFTKTLGNIFKDMIIAIQPKQFAAADEDESKIPQALIFQVCKLLQFAFKFDSIRMMRPILCNDFSYYRRWQQKYRNSTNVTVTDEVAMQMQMFSNQSNPMMTALIKELTSLQDLDPDACLPMALLANSCVKAMKTKRVSADKMDLCATAMTNAVVLYDQVDGVGAFSRKSAINIKGVITVLKNSALDSDKPMLLNSLKYSTKNATNAPESIQNLLEM